MRESQAMESDYFDLKYCLSFLQQHLKIGKFLANFIGQLHSFSSAFCHFPGHLSFITPYSALPLSLASPAPRPSTAGLQE